MKQTIVITGCSSGFGEISGTADFTLAQPHGTLRYTGELRAV